MQNKDLPLAHIIDPEGAPQEGLGTQAAPGFPTRGPHTPLLRRGEQEGCGQQLQASRPATQDAVRARGEGGVGWRGGRARGHREWGSPFCAAKCTLCPMSGWGSTEGQGEQARPGQRRAHARSTPPSLCPRSVLCTPQPLNRACRVHLVSQDSRLYRARHARSCASRELREGHEGTAVRNRPATGAGAQAAGLIAAGGPLLGG